MIVFNSTSVDEEIRPDRIYRHIKVEGNTLVWSEEGAQGRAGVNGM